MLKESFVPLCKLGLQNFYHQEAKFFLESQMSEPNFCESYQSQIFKRFLFIPHWIGETLKLLIFFQYPQL